MIKVSNLVEKIFATAVALDQSGGLKNTIYAIEDSIFVLNYDHTVLLRFKLRKSEEVFESGVSFKANDYDSDMFEQKGDRIVFHSETENFSRRKITGTTELSPEEVAELFDNYIENDTANRTEVVLPSEILTLLEEGLSHIEFYGEGEKGLKLVQRNIYSGGVIEITQKGSGLFPPETDFEFGPLGMKTDDFEALFSFQDKLKFSFPDPDSDDYFIVESIDQKKRNMTAIVSACLYDEIINLKSPKRKENPDGRKKQKKRRS